MVLKVTGGYIIYFRVDIGEYTAMRRLT